VLALPLCSWFVSINYTDYHYVQEAYMRGDEIATHTLNHVPNPGAPPFLAGGSEHAV
jgi:hypothetical protein